MAVRRGQLDPSQAKSPCCRTRLKVQMARRTCFKSNTIKAWEDITEAGKIAGPDPRKLYVRVWSVFHWYLWINVFVWARAFCGTRISCSASVDCSGAIRKIQVRKIGVAQDLVTWWNVFFVDKWPLDMPNWTLHNPKVRADAQGWKYTWHVELVSRAILYRHEKILRMQERLQAQTQEN